jgi:hypothetical protein
MTDRRRRTPGTPITRSWSKSFLHERISRFAFLASPPCSTHQISRNLAHRVVPVIHNLRGGNVLELMLFLTVIRILTTVGTRVAQSELGECDDIRRFKGWPHQYLPPFQVCLPDSCPAELQLTAMTFARFTTNMNSLWCGSSFTTRTQHVDHPLSSPRLRPLGSTAELPRGQGLPRCPRGSHLNSHRCKESSANCTLP